MTLNPQPLPLTKASQRIKAAVDGGRIHANLSDGTVEGARGNLLKPRRDRSGFLMVSFGGDYAYIHRIIAYAAFGEEALLPGRQVIHLNGNKTDNRASNLKVIAAGERRQPRRSPAPSAMPWKVIDPASGRAVAHFTSRQLAEEYAVFKFGSPQPARSRKSTPHGGSA